MHASIKPNPELLRELRAGSTPVTRRYQETAGDALLRLAKLGEKLNIKGPADLSSRIDDYLYGNK
jgi:hypothetical protein